MTVPFLPTGRDPAEPAHELARQQARSSLEELRGDCRLLAACLAADPADGHWHGVANAVYRVRLAHLCARLPGVLAAVDAADLALRVP